MQTSHRKINSVKLDGNNNIVIQDVTGSHIYINSDEGARKLIEDFGKEIGEIRNLLKQKQEPILQQFAEKIYNIAKIENANFYGEGRITIEKAGKITFDRRSLTEKQKDRLEMLEGLERRFQKRLNEKMKTELRFQLELNLEYTKEGTNETYLKDYYIDSYEEKSAESFERLFADYENTLKRLLILGEAGSGKTVLLLQFGLDLVEMAKQNFDYPMPILLNLATWRDENQTFETWLEENLVYAAGEYGTARKYAKEMVQENNLLLLLDGLDEIPQNDRKACLDKLRIFLDKLDNSRSTEDNFPTVIISSRKKDYLDLGEQAPVRASIILADLTAESVCKELERIKLSGSDFAKKLLNCIAEMPEIATKLKSAFEVHLSLNMAHTFDFSKLSTENLANAYLNQEIKKVETEYNYPKARHYLSFLATKMKENKKGLVFELVDMQPNWLSQYNFIRIFYPLFYSIFWSLFIFILLTKYGENYNDITTVLPLTYIILSVFAINFILFRNPKPIKIFELLKFKPTKINTDVFNNFFEKVRFRIFASSKADIATMYLYYAIISISIVIGTIFLVIILDLFGIKMVKDDIYSIKFLLGGAFVYSIFFFIFAFIGSIVIIVYYFFTEFTNTVTLIFFTIRRVPKIKYYYQRFYSSLLFNFLRYFLIVSFLLLSFNLLFNKLPIDEVIRDSYLYSTCFIIFLFISESPLINHLLLRYSSFKEKNIPLRLCTFLNQASQTGLMEKDGGQWRFRHQLLMDALIKKE